VVIHLEEAEESALLCPRMASEGTGPRGTSKAPTENDWSLTRLLISPNKKAFRVRLLCKSANINIRMEDGTITAGNDLVITREGWFDYYP